MAKKRTVKVFAVDTYGGNLFAAESTLSLVLDRYTGEGWDLEHVVHNRISDDRLEVALYLVRDDNSG